MVKAPQDFLAGVLFCLGSAFVFWVGWDYPGGTASQMSYGYFPRMLAGALFFLGALIVVRSFLYQGPPMPKFALRPLLALVAVCAFGFLVQKAGLAIATFALIVIGVCGSERFKLLDVIGISLLMIPLNWLVFIKLLNLPLTALPNW